MSVGHQVGGNPEQVVDAMVVVLERDARPQQTDVRLLQQIVSLGVVSVARYRYAHTCRPSDRRTRGTRLRPARIRRRPVTGTAASM